MQAIRAPDGQTSDARKCNRSPHHFFRKDFESNGHTCNYHGKWKLIDDGTGNKVLEANSSGYSLTSWTQADFGPATSGDYSIEFRLRFIEYDLSQDSSSGLAALVFRQGAPGSYVFVLNPYRHQIEMNYSSPIASWEHLEGEKGVRAHDFQKNVWYSIRIDAYGTQIKVLLDGEVMFTLEDPRLKEGSLAFLRGPNIIAQFDDVRVTK